MAAWLIEIQPFFLWYFAAINVIYLLLIILGSIQAYQRKRESVHEDYSSLLTSDHLPEFAFVIPMYNEENSILQTVESALGLRYRYKKIVVVNDGSTDGSMGRLMEAFAMVKIPKIYDDALKTRAVRGVYQSQKHPELMLVDKENGRKFDAINAGINAISSPYFIVLDADTYVDNKGFEAFIRPMLTDADAVCVGVCIRIKNGFSTVLTDIQEVEYLRAFTSRLGWNILNANFVISGAFSVFPRDFLVAAGGFVDTVGEDMEIVLRLHKIMLEKKKNYKIFYLPDPVAWTIVPETFKELAKQRTRWQVGLLEVLWMHRNMLFNPRYKHIGLVVYPFWVFGEMLGPLVEFLGYTYLIVAYCFGILSWEFFCLYICLMLGMAFLLSAYCLLVEEMSFRKYSLVKSMARLFCACLVENLGYHQLTVFWRLAAFPQFIKTAIRKRRSHSNRDRGGYFGNNGPLGCSRKIRGFHDGGKL